MSSSQEWRRDSDRMLVFAVRWAPFGGGDPYDICSLFGIDETTYFLRLTELLGTTDPPSGIDDLTWARLGRVARERLAAGQPDPHHPHGELPA